MAAKISDLTPAASMNLNSYSRRILAHLEDRVRRNKSTKAWIVPDDESDKEADLHFWTTMRWIHRSLPRYTSDPNVKTPQPDKSGSLQQIDLLRAFYLEIAQNGLAAAYERWGPAPPKPPPSEAVLIVGGGMSGMVAAYELKKAQYKNIKILEMSQRYGGRVKTFTMKDGFDRGLHSDGMYDNHHRCPALRIPIDNQSVLYW